MKPLRVLHLARVINRYDFIDTVVRHLPRARFEIEVATFEAEANIQSPEYESINIPCHLLRVPSMRSYSAYLKAALRLVQLLRERQIDILHTHHFWEGVVGALAKKLYPKVRFILHRHYTEDVIRVGGWKTQILLRLEQFCYNQADALLVPTRTIRVCVERLHSSVRLPRIVEIPYGFEFEAPKYQPASVEERRKIREFYGVPEEMTLIANIGTHRFQKGQIELLDAFSKLQAEIPTVELWFIGEGPDTPALKEKAQPLREKVRFLGWQRGETIRTLLAAVDMVAHPSYSEAFPQVMVETLAMERALLITEVSGAKELLEHQKTAWLIPYPDPEIIYEGLRRLTLSPELRLQMGSAGRRKILSSLSYTQINQLYEQLYTELCSL
ncbi:MAG: glycosyltransferase family 4 protein [Bacteroidia bacterium]|nr:glycosyltransferase family 4 protein [Bacteroidia bacterium]